jgi:ElaB/YqjD/DUF883 family membrane-anchored ribosome-binding protein
MADENVMSQGPSVSPKRQEDFSSGARATGKEIWNDAARRVRDLQGDTKQYVRENPTKAVFTALAIGFVLGLLRRR